MQNLTSITQTAAGNLVVKSGKTLTGNVTANASTIDGLGSRGCARVTFNPSANSGDRTVAAHASTVALPAGAVVIGGFYEVNTAFTSASTNTGTIAISVVGANDIVTATAVSDGIYGTTGLKAIVPKNNTPESTGIKCATAKYVTFTVAVAALTAGKLTLHLDYVITAATA